MLSAAAGVSATLECPVPVARWQSRHEHINIETTGPFTAISMAPQAQVAVTLMFGRWVVLIG